MSTTNRTKYASTKEHFLYMVMCGSIEQLEKQDASFVQTPSVLRNEGWELLCPDYKNLQPLFKQHGYFSIIYQHVHKNRIVICHRGTRVYEIGNLFADFEIMKAQTPQIFEAASALVDCLLTHIDHLNKYYIMHTGFLLGGCIAAGCVIQHRKHKSIQSARACTFDAPGFHFVNYSEAHAHKIVNYVMDLNLVNTWHQHVGEIRHLETDGTEDQEFHGSLASKLCITYKRHNLSAALRWYEKKQILTYNLVDSWPLARWKPIYSKQKPTEWKTVANNPFGVNILIALLNSTKERVWMATYTEKDGGVISVEHVVDGSISYKPRKKRKLE